MHTRRALLDAIGCFNRNERWGTCIYCPMIDDFTYPEKCENGKTHQHNLTKRDLEEQIIFYNLKWKRPKEEFIPLNVLKDKKE